MPVYWGRHIAPERAPADRPLPSRVDVLVVGGGFLGLWLARFLRARRPALELLVLERDAFPCGASARNAGFLTCGQLGEMVADARESGEEAVLETFARRAEGVELLRRELGAALPLDPCGSADFDGVTEETRALASKLAPAFVERDLPFGGGTRRVFFAPRDAGVDPVRVLDLLRRGAPVRHGVAVDAVGGGVARAGGREIAYGHAFLCTNAFAGELAPASDVEPGRGQVIVTSPVETATARVLGFLDYGYDYFRFVDGRLLLGGGRRRFAERERTRDAAPTEEVVVYLAGRAREILGHDRFTIEWRWAGIMGFPGGRHVPAYPRHRMDDRTTLVAGCGGMGVALAPATARDLAREFLA